MENKVILKKEFIRILAKKAGFTIGDTYRFWKAVELILKDCVETGTELNLKGFGHLRYTIVPERKMLNPSTLEPVTLPPATRIVFTVSKALSDSIRDVSKRHYRSAKRRKQAIAEMMEKLNKPA